MQARTLFCIQSLLACTWQCLAQMHACQRKDVTCKDLFACMCAYFALILHTICIHPARMHQLAYWLHALLSYCMLFAYICIDINSIYVTRFAKRGLTHAQFQNALFIVICKLHMHQQHMCLILLKVEQSAITQAFFSRLSDIHECSGGP